VAPETPTVQQLGISYFIIAMPIRIGGQTHRDSFHIAAFAS
jgi:hypothetical protein